MKYKVRYLVEFETEIECSPEDLQDAVCDVDIPETDKVTYVEDSFVVITVEDENGKGPCLVVPLVTITPRR